MKKTHCRKGHEFTEENTYVYPDGRRKCLICARSNNQKWYIENIEYERARSKEYGKNNRDKLNKYMREWSKNNPDKVRDVSLQSRYGIGLEDYEAMYTSQEGRCAICGNSFPQLHVDHDHDTQEVRGLLCRVCNIGLGHFKDSPSLLARAVRYLEKQLITPGD